MYMQRNNCVRIRNLYSLHIHTKLLSVYRIYLICYVVGIYVRVFMLNQSKGGRFVYALSVLKVN